MAEPRNRSILLAFSTIMALALVAAMVAGPSAFATSSSGGYTWVQQSPLPGSNTLYATAAVTATASWSVGAYGCVMYYNGTELAGKTSNTTNDLYAVDAVSVSDVYAVGQNKTIIHYNGTSWSVQPAPTDANNQYNYCLFGVAAVSATNIWAVGGEDGFRNAVILHNNTGTAAGWHFEKNQSLDPAFASGGLQAVCALSTGQVWAVGQDYSNGRTYYFNGSAWTLRDTARALISVSAYDVNNVWGVCWDGTVVRSVNGGASYSDVTSITDTSWPACVKAYSSQAAWVAGWGAGSISATTTERLSRRRTPPPRRTSTASTRSTRRTRSLEGRASSSCSAARGAL